MGSMMAEFDLNLVRTFVLLYETRSVTATSVALHVTQPTVSYSLQKLRRRFDDQLFRRSTGGLVPTARAVGLYDPLRSALAEIERAVAPALTFEPATASARFTIALSDIGEVSLLPRLLEALVDVAPGVTLTVRPLDVAEAEGQLGRGELDAFVATPVILSDRITRLPLYQEGYVGVVRDSHPRLRGATVTRGELAAERLVRVLGSTGHTGPAQALEAEGLGGRVALDLARFAALPRVLARTELVAFAPHYVAEVFATVHAVRFFELPWPVDPVEVAVYARHPHARSAAQQWLVEFMAHTLRLPAWSTADRGVRPAGGSPRG